MKTQKQLWLVNLGDNDTIKVRAKNLTELEKIINQGKEFDASMINWVKRDIPNTQDKETYGL